MLEKVINYLVKLGYTVEEQGRLEKYLVVFKEGRPIGFILSDLSVKVVSDANCEHIQEVLEFIRKNQNLQSIGGSEFLLASFRGNQLTTYYDEKTKLVKYSTYIHDDKGEVFNATYESYDTAVYRFVTQTQMLDMKKYLPTQQSLGNKLRKKLIHYLEAEQP